MTSKFTKKRRAAIIEALRAGNYAKAAAEHNGISEQTYHNWIKEGEREVGPIP